LGYDPFFPNSDKTIIARIVREANKLRGEVELVDEHGTQAGKREFSAEPDQCEQLVHAMALSISIAIDPKSAETYGQGPADVPAPDPAENQADSQPDGDSSVAPVPAAPLRVSDLQPAPSARTPSWLWSAGLGATVQFGAMPATALGAVAFAALRNGTWSLAVEGELDAPVTTQQNGVELRSAGGALKLVPCGHWKLLRACQVTVLRWHSASGNVSGIGGSAGSFALGGRLGLELPLSRTIGALAYGDLLLTALPVRLESEGHTLWKMPILSGGIGIAAVAHF
jgi:hypothetical protein